MALKVTARIPYGNAGGLKVRTGDDMPEVCFSPSPAGGPETLWFCFSIRETTPEKSAGGKVRITLEHFINLLGNSAPTDMVPVYCKAGQGWHRLSGGLSTVQPDGQMSVSWTVPYPEPRVDVALCYPYGKPEIEALLAKSKGYWKKDVIGLSQGGRPLLRLANDYGQPGSKRRGLYLVARQHSGETPGSWVLDGVMQYFSRSRKVPFTTWVVPLANADGVARGEYGKDNFPYDLNRAWGSPPMRHETLVYQRDIARWRERCEPAFGLDFHAPGGCESSGVYCFLPPADAFPEMHRAAAKLANVIKEELGSEYAAKDFKREVTYRSRWETPPFWRYFVESLGVPALSMETPYSKIGTQVLSQKQYREIGERVARALMLKKGSG